MKRVEISHHISRGKFITGADHLSADLNKATMRDFNAKFEGEVNGTR